MKEHILVIDDNEDDYLIIRRFLKEDFQVSYNNGSNSEEVLKTLRADSPACILLDYNLGPHKGLDLLKKIQSHEELSHISVIMLTNEVDPAVIVDCVKNNAENYLIKDSITKEGIYAAIQRGVKEKYLRETIQAQQLEILRLSRTDALTGLANRRYFIESMEQRIAEQTKERIISLATLDLDKFKEVNDTYGHAVGDQVLILLSRLMDETLPSAALRCRLGGDEFTVALCDVGEPDIDKVSAIHEKELCDLSRRFKSEVSDLLSPLAGERLPSPSLSAGLFTTKMRKNLTFADLFKVSDACLYYVKRNGRNNIATLISEDITSVLPPHDKLDIKLCREEGEKE